MTDRLSSRGRAGRRRADGAFTLVEVLLAVGLFAILFGVVFLLARDFLFSFLWSGETVTGVHEAALLHATLRRDFMRVGVASQGADLAVQISPGALTLTLAGTGPGERIQYRFDPRARVLWREAPGGPPQPLGQGLVRKFEVVRAYLRKLPGPRFETATALPAGERPYRAGVQVSLGLQGQEVGGTRIVRTIDFSTHIFPVFANLRLSSIWREH